MKFRNLGLFAFAIIIFAVICVPNPFTAAAALSELKDGHIECSGSAKAAYLLDAGSGRCFYAKNESAKLPMASTTKIVTAITVIENCPDLDQKIKVDNRAIGVEGTSIYLRKGEELTVRELLYGLMLRSGNDAATALAYYIGGGIPEFCQLMKNTAIAAGAENSDFANPHGLDAEGHYTTAKDLALITAYALDNPVFREIVSTKTIKIGSQEEEYRFLANKNRLLNSLPGCIGVKTGYTGKAGRCLVSACERDGLRLVCVVLSCGPMFEESANMIEAVYAKYKNFTVLEPYSYISSVPVENGEVEKVDVYSKKGFKIPLTDEEYAKLNVNFDLPTVLDAPLENEQEVGKVEVYYDKDLIFEEKIYTMDKVDSKLLKDKVKDILDNWSV